MTITEEQFDRESAEEICVLGGAEEQPESIFLLDESREPAQVLNKYAAQALAARLLTLADQLLEPPRIRPRD